MSGYVRAAAMIIALVAAQALVVSALIFLILQARPVPRASVLAGETRPYSCRLYDDERRKCAFGSCNQQTLDQLEKDCLIAGGRP